MQSLRGIMIVWPLAVMALAPLHAEEPPATRPAPKSIFDMDNTPSPRRETATPTAPTAPPSTPAKPPAVSVGVSQDRLARLRAFGADLLPAGVARESLAHTDPLHDEVTWEAKPEGYTLADHLQVGQDKSNHKGDDITAHVHVRPGFALEGGTIRVSRGSLEFQGTSERPILLRNVRIECEWRGKVTATHTIFDNCTFAKAGPWFYTGGYSSKWELQDCLLRKSNFAKLWKVDFGLKIQHCTFVDCKLPNRNSEPKNEDDSARLSRAEWSFLSDSDFYNCEMSASIIWILQRCNLFGCTPFEKATFASESVFVVELGIPADVRDAVVQDFRERNAVRGTGKLALKGVDPIANGAYPK